MKRPKHNQDAISVEQLALECDCTEREARRIAISLKHESEIYGGMAYSSYEHRHEAPDRIGVFRSGKVLAD